ECSTRRSPRPRWSDWPSARRSTACARWWKFSSVIFSRWPWISSRAPRAAPLHYMPGGGVSVPMVVRNKFAPRPGGGPSHSSCNHGAFIHFPGLKIIMPTTPADAKGLLLSAIRDPNPVLCFESHHLYGQRGPCRMEITLADRGRRHWKRGQGSHHRDLRRHGSESRRRSGCVEREGHCHRDRRSAFLGAARQGNNSQIRGENQARHRARRGPDDRRTVC